MPIPVPIAIPNRNRGPSFLVAVVAEKLVDGRLYDDRHLHVVVEAAFSSRIFVS